MGSTISEIVYGVGGGIKGGRDFKAVQLGGPSGGCVPAALIDTPIDYESLAATGAIMGSGGMVVADDQTCMVDLARYFLQFTQNESCGKCVPCRLGTKRMLEILERITAGEGEDGDIETPREARRHDQAHEPLRPRPDRAQPGAHHASATSATSTRPTSTDAACPARACSALITYHIDPETCTGCGLCAKKCPVGAVSGERKQAHAIDRALCTKCDTCRQVCRFESVVAPHRRRGRTGGRHRRFAGVGPQARSAGQASRLASRGRGSPAEATDPSHWRARCDILACVGGSQQPGRSFPFAAVDRPGLSESDARSMLAVRILRGFATG